MGRAYIFNGFKINFYMTICTGTGTTSTISSDPWCISEFGFQCSTSTSTIRIKAATLDLELELELIQTQMAQKPMLRAEVYAHAMRASQNRKKI